MKSNHIRFGIIGCGVMGREFASAVARWCHLTGMTARPLITAICNRSLTPERIDWFTDNFPSIKQVTDDYRELLANDDLDAVYVAVPHNKHAEIYCATLEAGKHLMGEKPFGMNLPQNDAIMQSVESHPDILVRCASQFLFLPAVQRIGRMIEDRGFGDIIEVNAGFLHCSDLNPRKPINWKRIVEINGEYGSMGDLGPHTYSVIARAGFQPLNVRAVLSNIMPNRPDSQGRMVPCETWDNATLLCQARDAASGSIFPLTVKTQRISPGQKNNWYIEILGTGAGARYSMNNANQLSILEYSGGEQEWRTVDMGSTVAFESVTPPIHQFGMSDAILQMWGAFVWELQQNKPRSRFSGCMRPDETAACHRLFTAALESHEKNTTVTL